MLVSYNWLQKYFKDKLPAPAVVENGIIFHAFEVEGMEEKSGDCLMEIKILPDRAHDCLCHEGIAREVGAILNLSFVKPEIKEVVSVPTSRELKINITEPKLCRRYIGRMIENVTVGESPAWLREKLELIGQRSINAVVDSANYAMFDLGQPMHAFDADKVVGGITVRLAKEGEKITTLDNKDVALDPSVLVIADDEGPLAIAGIKGGKRAEVTTATKNLILESANFDPVKIRKTSAKIGIRTDASKRYENELTQELADEAMSELTVLLTENVITAESKVGEKVDVYPTKAVKRQIEVRPTEISAMLGVEVPTNEMVRILASLGLGVEKSGEILKLDIPARRIDLEAPENIVEEVGRIYGYDKVPEQLLSPEFAREGERTEAKSYRVEGLAKETLLNAGYSEIYGYALGDKGEVELANPLASDKSLLRTNLSDFIARSLGFNLQNVLFDNEPVRIFEIGRVFTKDKEQTNICFALGYKKQKKIKEDDLREELSRVSGELNKALGIADFDWVIDFSVKTLFGQECLLGIIEANFDELARVTTVTGTADLSSFISPATVTYKPTPACPRIIRDVALFVPTGTEVEKIEKIIKENAGQLLFAGPFKFDEFAKDGKVSYAFRLVFQSYEKTLSDEEVNGVMEKVVEKLKEEKWEVR